MKILQQNPRISAGHRHVAWYGWRRDLPDPRDLLYSASREVVRSLPKRMDLRPKCPGVYDQKELGSCTANAIAGAFEYDLIRQRQKAFVPSRLFIYYNERCVEGTIGQDSGAQLRDGIKTLVRNGVCPEKNWPYVIRRFDEKPPAPCYANALHHQIVMYQRLVPSLTQLRACLAEGFPFIFGFTVFNSFESDAVKASGVVPLPNTTQDVPVGGHAVMAVGYDDEAQVFIVRNSWGRAWGDRGYFYLPYVYVTDAQLAADFWTLRRVEEPGQQAQVRLLHGRDMDRLRPSALVKDPRRTTALQAVEAVMGQWLRVPAELNGKRAAWVESRSIRLNRDIQSLPEDEANAVLHAVRQRLPWSAHWLYPLKKYPTVGDLVTDALT